jgi:hypothetical protein
MHTQSSGSRHGGNARLERAIVLELLSDDDADGRDVGELEAMLGAAAGGLDSALRELTDAGVLDSSEGRLRPSAAARRLDELELIGI